MTWPPEALAFIETARAAHLATADAEGVPHVVPICFAFDGERFFSVIDQKPKRAQPRALKRIRNIEQNRNVSLVIDRYDEDWSRLGYILITGSARVVESQTALRLLRDKYPQYRDMELEDRPIIEITPGSVFCWGVLG